MVFMSPTSVDPSVSPLRGQPSPTAVLVFDGDCGFCTWSAGLLRRWSRDGLTVVPWQRVDLAGLGLTAAECARAVQCVTPDGTYSGGQAVARSLRGCRQPWRTAGAVLALPALRPVVERGYAWVADHRHRLPGSTPACRMALDDDAWGSVGIRGQRAGEPVPPPLG